MIWGETVDDVKWVKLSTSMFDDEKIKIIEKMPDADTILVIWVKLLSQAGKTNSSGYIFLSENIPYTDEMLATIFDRPISTIRLALNTFQDLGMLGIDKSSFISITNWEKYQNVEGMERIKEQNRTRKRKQREKEQPKIPSHAKSRDSHATELELDIDKDKERESSISKVQEIYNHYISKDIINHQKITSAMRTSINARLRDYSHEQLIQAIDNYSTVYHSDEYWFDTKYGLTDLMRDKDVRKFIDEAEPVKNFSISKTPSNIKIDWSGFNVDD